MSKIYLRAYPERLIGNELFTEASKEELRVLLAIISSGEESSEELIAAAAKCPLSRCKAAITLFSSEGIIEISDTPFLSDTIKFEHGTVSHFSDIEEDAPLKVAEDIKRYDLSALLDECAVLLDKAALSSTEAAKIVTLVTSFSLDGEYIITLLSHLKSKRQANAVMLVKKAEELIGRGIKSYEELEEYIRSCEVPGYVHEFRNTLGIKYRAVSETEMECYKKWAEEFDFTNEILALAYDKAVLAGSPNSLQYIDAVLTAWYNAGCKTVADCKKNNQEFKDAKEAEKREHQAEKKKRPKSEEPTPRYGNFDVEEAFRLALSRSYGEESDK